MDLLLLQDKADDCVDEAIVANDADEQRRKFGELLEVFEKACL